LPTIADQIGTDGVCQHKPPTYVQYGVTDTAGTAPGMLNPPNGFDLLLPDGSTPTYSATQ
jgi:hypothetical protein